MNASNGSLVNASYCKALFERDDSEQLTGLEWVGLLLAACSTFISTYCLLWIKRSTIVEMGFPLCPCQCCGGRYGGPWKRIFVIAMCGNIVSEALLSSTAYVFAPLSLILPVGGSALIFTGVLTRLGVVPGIKEHLSPVEWVTLGFTALAMVGTSAFGPKAESVPPFDDWQAQWQRPAVPMHYALTMLAGLVWTALVTRLSHLNPWREGTTVYAILSALTSGALGSWAVLFTKVYSTAIQIALSTGDTRAASLWITWFAVAGFAISGPAQLFLMHKSLTGGRASFGVPLYFIVIINCTICLDGLFFRVFECMPRTDVALFAFSLSCVVLGTAAMAFQQERRKGLDAKVEAIEQQQSARAPVVEL